MLRRTHRAHLESLVAVEAARTWPRPERRRLIILFTPRSGSSWFGDLLSSTKAVGNPEEFLNQEINADVVRRFVARTETDYLNAIETATASENGIFSMEVLWGHIEESEFDILDYYRDAHFVYLRRRDILAQAVSLLLATQTGVFHNPGGAPPSQAGKGKLWASPDQAFAGIRRWWGHVLNYECLTEVQLATRKIRPLRLYYEEIAAAPADGVNRVLALCGLPPADPAGLSSSFAPVGSGLNVELARLFGAADGGFVRTMNSFRPPLT